MRKCSTLGGIVEGILKAMVNLLPFLFDHCRGHFVVSKESRTYIKRSQKHEKSQLKIVMYINQQGMSDRRSFDRRSRSLYHARDMYMIKKYSMKIQSRNLIHDNRLFQKCTFKWCQKQRSLTGSFSQKWSRFR